MDPIILCLKLLIFSIMGFYLIKLFKGYNDIFYGIIAPFYGIFGIISVFCTNLRMPTVYLIGILAGPLLNYFLGIIDKRLKVNINFRLFGLFNILNTFVLNGLIDYFLNSSSYISITFLFIGGMIIYILDIAFSLRKLI